MFGLLQSINKNVKGTKGIFTCLQKNLRQAQGQRVPLSLAVHDELSTWCRLVRDLENRSTHMREINPSPPTWVGTIYASGTGMGGVIHKTRRTMVHVVLTNVIGDASQTHLQHEPQGGSDNQQSGTSGAASIDPPFSAQYATLGPNPHSFG